jgi:hypothetical protein
MAKYKRCCSCDYWVTSSDKRCPNCGISDPRADRMERTDTLAVEAPMTDGTRAAFGGFVGMVIGGMLMGGMGVAVGVAVGVSLGVLLGADRDWAPPEIPNLARKAVDSMKQREETIRQRLDDIARRERNLEETRAQVATLSQAEQVRQVIDQASLSLARQRDRYHAGLWDIALVRWQNRIEPLYADWETLTHESCNQRLRQLEVAREEGEKYVAAWSHVELGDAPEAKRCLERLRGTLAACDQLRENLIVQQATLAVKGIAPIEETLQSATPGASLKSLDAFSARASLGEFNRAFDELESEYNRLRSEEELADRAALVQRLGHG